MMVALAAWSLVLARWLLRLAERLAPGELRKVETYGLAVPLATGALCDHGRDVAYNLSVGIVIHRDDRSRCKGWTLITGGESFTWR